MTILYEKVGRRYKPVMADDWYSDQRMINMERPGHLLVTIDDSCRHYMRDVRPEYAPVMSALIELREEMLKAMHRAAEFKPKTTRLSEAHQKAYAQYQESIPGEEREALWAGSIAEGLDAAMIVLKNRVIKQGNDTCEHAK